MYPVSERFLTALESGAIQHIDGEIRLNDGSVIELSDDNLIGSPRFDRQCTENSEIFAIGQLYTGTVELDVYLPQIMREELKGGSVSLNFGVDVGDGETDSIPLGVWTITSPERTAEGRVHIRGNDCISRLDVAINDKSVGVITAENRLNMVTFLTGVEFAQTIDELNELCGSGVNLRSRYGTRYCNTCREEVTALAAFMGCMAYADRHGRIAFKKFGQLFDGSGSETVPRIGADRRFSARLSEYSFGIRAVGYTDEYGEYSEKSWEKAPVTNTVATVKLQDNPYFLDGPVERYLSIAAKNLEEIPDYVPGEISFYGNPALDLGDRVFIVGGLNGKDDSGGSISRFLITADSWQFRGPHTLISAGAAEEGVSSAASVNSAVSAAVTNINITKSLTSAELEVFTGELSELPTVVAEGAFSCRTEALIFADITANILGIKPSVTELRILLDGVMQTVFTSDSVGADERKTVHFSVPITVSQGTHTVSVEAVGNAEILRIFACIWGQEITAELSETTIDTDYEFHTEDGHAVIDRYKGSSLRPKIPQKIGGFPVGVIGIESFTESAAEYAKIAEGTSEIL